MTEGAQRDSGRVECDFCEIAQGNSRGAQIVADAPTWLAFFPPEPATPGHTLIIPRAHVRDMWELQDEEIAKSLMGAVIKVGRAIQEALEPEGMNLITSAGDAAEQTVWHLHLHLVPRWHTDGFGRIWPPKRHTPSEIKKDLAARIRASLPTETV